MYWVVKALEKFDKDHGNSIVAIDQIRQNDSSSSLDICKIPSGAVDSIKDISIEIEYHIIQ